MSEGEWQRREGWGKGIEYGTAAPASTKCSISINTRVSCGQSWRKQKQVANQVAAKAQEAAKELLNQQIQHTKQRLIRATLSAAHYYRVYAAG